MERNPLNSSKDRQVKKINQIKELNRLLRKIDELFDDTTRYPDQLGDLAQLLIPVMADWCCIHMVKEDGSLENTVFVPAEKASFQAVYNWVKNDLPNDEADGLPAALSDGKTKIVVQVSPMRRGADAGIKSYLIVPLITPRRTIGLLTLIYAESDRRYDMRTLNFAENLALHINKYLDQPAHQNHGQLSQADLGQRDGEGAGELTDTMTQLKQTEEVVQTLFRVSNKLNATLDVEQILDTLAQEAIQLVNGESGFAGLRTAEGMTVHKYFHEGAAIPFEHTWAVGEGIPGWVLKYKVPYGTSDADNDPLISRELAINTNVHSIICTPILDTVGEVIAYFDIRNKKGEEGFSINDQEMLLTLAPVASIAIQNALAYQQRQATVIELRQSAIQLQELAVSLESAREEERLQVSRELHDELGQTLTALKFDLAWLADQLEHKDENLAQKAKDITSQVNTLIKTVRRIATELRPGMLDDLGLAASIEWQVQDFEKRSGVECELSLPGDEINLSHDQSLAIFRIFQEALTNIARHANAKHVDVSLETKGDWLTLSLQDDGRGINTDEISSLRSLGLLGMRERAKYLGGEFEIMGKPGQGTTLKVTIPITRQA